MIEWKKEGRVWISREDGESLMWVVEIRKEYNTTDKEYFVVGWEDKAELTTKRLTDNAHTPEDAINLLGAIQ